MENWYGSSWSNVIKELESDIDTGIFCSSIEDRKNKYGKNLIIIEKEKRPLIKNIISFDSIHIVINIILAILFILEGRLFQGIALFITILFYIGFEYYNFRISTNKAKQIERLNIGKARCIRDGSIQTIDIAEIVVGDIVILEEGAAVPADIRVVESESLYVKESSVTGKDEIVEKYETRIYGEVDNLWEIKNIIFKSSTIIKGECTGIVVAVGMDTQIGKIVAGSNIKEEKDDFINTFKKLSNKFKNIAWAAVLFVALYSWMQQKTSFEIFEFMKLSLYSLYLNVTIVTGIIFSLYMKRIMKEKGIDFYNIFSMQKIASIDSIIINDRGFLCEEEMHVKELFCDGVHANEFSVDQLNEYNANRIFHIGLLCNNAKTESTARMDSESSYLGDPSEAGLLRFAKARLLSKKELEKINPRLFQIPMDSEKNIMTTVNKVEEYYRANVKGESEEILKRCTHIMKNGVEVEISQSDIENIKRTIIQMSNNALKVIGFAYRNFNYEPSLDENIESHLVFVGLVGMENSVKDYCVSNLEKCEKLHIKTVLMTENNKLYAYALGKKLGIIKKNEEILSGIEFKYMNKEEQIRIIDKIKIYSKIFIKDKTTLLKYLNGMKKTTAICTNNFNDLPAFNEAAVGIAYGEKCSNTIRRIGDIFISNSSFYSIIDIIKNCRINLISINIALYYFIVINIAQLLLIIVQQLYFPLNIDYTFISIINLLCLPLNIMFILFRQKYDDDVIENYYGVKLKLSLRYKPIIVSLFKIFILLLISFYIIFRFQIVNSSIINFIIFSLVQLTIVRAFEKYEIH